MRITIERLRTWIVLLGILLVVAIAAFLGYARYRIHQVARDLPQKLGLEIQQSTDNFTISKSHEGHTLFTLHASKAIQYKNSGHLTLHEVSIVIFGKDGSRADRISGSHFEYDPSTKTAKALGPVEIELTDPSAAAAAKKQPSGPPPVPIKVATSDLVFNQDSQVASTDQPLTFQKGDASGSARGATFDSGKGTLLLAHDVILHGEIDDDPIVVKADGANFDRNNRQLYFIREQTDYQQQHVSSDQAVVFFNPDGGADHLTAEGNVHFATDDGSDLRASAGSAQLDAKGALKQVKLDGGLLFVSHDEKHSLHIDSNSGTFTFSSNSGGGKKTTPTHLQLVGAVSAVDQQISLLGDAHGSETRESRADKMDVDLATDNTGHVQAQSVLASGGAVVNVHTIRANAPQQITVLKGDQIYATIENGHEISSLRATGDTALEQSTPGGQDQTSSADALLVKFVPGTGGSSKTNKPASPKTGSGLQSLGSQGSQIASAVQEGHATLVQIQPGTAAGAEPGKTTASADRITYDGASHKIQLTGGTPRIVQSGSELTAAVIEFNQGTGDASASGGIKATYTNPNAGPAKAAASGTGSEAMHIIADHAALDHAKNETTFLGAAHADARLWQGNNAVTAPTIVLSRARQLLTATGPAGGVKAALVESGSGRKAKSASPAATGPSVIRTSSSMLVYSGGERKVTLSGGVTAQNATGTIKASVVELFLNPNAPVAGEKTKAAAAGNPMGPDGQVDRLIAEDHVQITQGERSGSGTKLVYTADDGHFLLTGTTAAPPRITDPQHGTVSGSSLIFNDRDDSVVVSHGQSPTMTDTRTSNDVRKPAQ